MRRTRAFAAAIVAAGLSAVGAASTAEPGVREATHRTRVVDVATLDGAGGRVRVADVDLRGRLPEGFALDPSAAPVALEVELNGVVVWGGDEGPMPLAPTGRGARWGPAPSNDPDWSVEYAPWLRATVDVRRGTFRFRTRGVEHTVMEGYPVAVPYVVRIGGREIAGTLDFAVARPNLWRTRGRGAAGQPESVGLGRRRGH